MNPVKLAEDNSRNKQIAKRPISSTSKNKLREAAGLVQSARKLLAEISNKDYRVIQARIVSDPNMMKSDQLFYFYPYIALSDMAEYLDAAWKHKEESDDNAQTT